MDEPSITQPDHNNPYSYQDSLTEVRFRLTLTEFQQLQKMAQHERTTVDELAKRMVASQIDLSTDQASQLPRKWLVEGKRREPRTTRASGQNAHISYAPLVALLLLFLAGLLLILLYAGAKELGLIGDPTQVAPLASATSGIERKSDTIATFTATSVSVPTQTPNPPTATYTPTSTYRPTGNYVQSPTPVSDELATPLSISEGTQTVSPPGLIIAAASIYSTTITITTYEGQSLAELVRQADQDIEAVLMISRTIMLLPNQQITLTLGGMNGWTEERPRYVFPVHPPEIAKFDRGHHDYPATDVFAPKRAVIVAVTDGSIYEMSRADTWDPNVDDPATRGGISVSIVGSDGWRYYYSHLGELRKDLALGDHVATGEILGYLGDSGNARGVPQLHFGISKPTVPGDWEVRRGQVLPYPFLQAWLHNENKTPTAAK